VKAGIRNFHLNIVPWEQNSGYSEVLLTLMSDRFFDFYELSEIAFDETDIDNLLTPMNIDNIKELFNLMARKYDLEMLEVVFELKLVHKMSNTIIDEMYWEIND
jgi:hypothetical protein